ncbi:hypothetical protein [Synechococcus sp. PCC 7336]|uniref:hypothetical protein n=1 Tax=Synechococcus sp. PCC 7336 TaxID=195250 RepID=UPI00034D19A9|nr:hypothetical protein [Synechococcus sp. PCC 7336]
MNVTRQNFVPISLIGISLFVLAGMPLLAQIEAENPAVPSETATETVMTPGQMRQQQQQMMGQMQERMGRMQERMGQMTPEQMGQHHQRMMGQMAQMAEQMDRMMSQAGNGMMGGPDRQAGPMMMDDSGRGPRQEMMGSPSQLSEPETGDLTVEE